MAEVKVPEYIIAQDEMRGFTVRQARTQGPAILAKHGLDFIKNGSERVVGVIPSREQSKYEEEFDIPGPGEWVMALDYDQLKTVEEAQTLQHVQELLSALFPHNFPKFHFSYGQHPKNHENSGTKRRYLSNETFSDPEEYKLANELSRFPFQAVLDTIAKYNIPIGIDTNEWNFMRGADGGVYYIDTPIVHAAEGRWQMPGLVDDMKKNGYSNNAILIVQNAINRLVRLHPKTKT